MHVKRAILVTPVWLDEPTSLRTLVKNDCGIVRIVMRPIAHPQADPVECCILLSEAS